MKILLLCEPRSGSTNLTNWFFKNKKFTILFNPDVKLNNKWYQDKNHPNDYLYHTKHLFIKEDYYHYKNYDKFVITADKIICLYRENEYEQIESWTNAKETNNWDGSWISNGLKNDNEIIFFKELKKSFQEEYLSKDYFKISYEELYFNNGFQKILDYLNIDELENKGFPVGQKYRINATKTKTFI